MTPRGEDVVLANGVRIPRGELRIEASRSGGPGGQNVNKVESRVSLRFDVRNSPALPEPVRERLLRRLAPRLTAAGELVLHAREHRERSRNLAAALERLKAVLDAALHRDKPRKKTRPTRGSVERRIAARKHRSSIKRLRRRPDD